MLRLFRVIRERLVSEGKVRTYLLYAVGEIFLVVIGILIALQVNNWNQDRILHNKMRDYYAEIKTEVENAIIDSKSYIETDSMLVSKIYRSLEILDQANPDSLEELKYTLGAVATAYAYNFSFPITREFVSNGYISSIENDSLKLGIRYLMTVLDSQESMNSYIDNQYQLKIEPFFNTNINYSQVLLERHRRDNYIGGPDTDFKKLINNMEAWNVINFKLETTSANLYRYRGTLDFLYFLNRQLESSLDI